METMTELYSRDALRRLERRTKTEKYGLAAFCLLSLGVCVALCLLTGTRNAAAMERRVIAVSTLCGWLAIYRFSFGYLRSRHAAAHAARMLAGERRAIRGRLERTGETVRIPGSVRVESLRLAVEGEESPRRLNVLADAAGLLPASGTEITAVTVERYLVAFGEAHENS